MYQPNSFFGMLPENKKVPARCKGRGEGDGDDPFLHTQVTLISKHEDNIVIGKQKYDIGT